MFSLKLAVPRKLKHLWRSIAERLLSIERNIDQMALDLTALTAAVAKVQTEVSETATQVQILRDKIAELDPAAAQAALDTIATQLNAAASSLDSLQDHEAPPGQ